MARKGTVEQSLSAEQLHDFCTTLAGTPNLTLKVMQTEAAKLGIELSHSAAGRFKSGTFAAHIEHLRKAKELAMQIEEFGGADSAGSLADAGAAVLMQQVYDALTSGDNLDFDTFSKIIARLRTGDHRQRELNAKLREYERKESEWERKESERRTALAAIAETSSGKEITPEFIEEVQKAMGLK